ncbi:hypothetical protein MMC25_002189 [Agyrium rufum]|nr:hypothetical protein [Agyrium rufum]
MSDYNDQQQQGYDQNQSGGYDQQQGQQGQYNTQQQEQPQQQQQQGGQQEQSGLGGKAGFMGAAEDGMADNFVNQEVDKVAGDFGVPQGMDGAINGEVDREANKFI